MGSGNTGVYSVEWEVEIVEIEVSSVWNVKCGIRSIDCGRGNGKWGLLGAKCEVWSV